MANEIVKYDNQLNQVCFQGSGITDNLLKIFFSIVAKARDNGLEEITISFDEMRKLTADNSHYTDAEYKELIKRLMHVLINLKVSYDAGPNFGEHNIFTGYDSSLEENKIVVRTTPIAQRLFNNLEYNFTRFELKEFVELPGIYTKQLYRLLKQYRHVGNYTLTIKDLRKYMDVPEGYKTKDLTRRVINPAVSNLINNVPEFVTLNYEYMFSGRKAIKVKFKWMPEKRYIEMTDEEKQRHDAFKRKLELERKRGKVI